MVDLESPSPPETTAGPSLELARRDAANFMGYTYYDGAWVSVTCAGGKTFTESKPFGTTNPGYAGCYSTGEIATACSLGTVYYPSGNLYCNAGYSCVTGIIATTSGAELSGDLDFQCNDISDWVLYKTTPAAAKTTAVVQTTPTTNNQVVNTATQTTVVTSVQIAAGSTATGTTSEGTAVGLSATGTSGASSSTKSTSSKGISGAAVAGAVVGPICAVALILGLAFLFLRRKKNNNNNNAAAAAAGAAPGTAPPHNPQSAYAANYGGYSEGKEATQNPPPPPPQQHPQPQYAPSYGGYSETKEAAQVNVASVNPHMSVPPAYASHGHAMPPAEMGNIGGVPLQHMNPPAPSPIDQQTTHSMAPTAPLPSELGSNTSWRSGPVPTELDTNPQVTGMPPELAAYPR